MLIDFVAADADRPLERSRTFIRAPGGAPANVSVALARLGVSVAFVGKIGADVFGRSLRETLVGEGVDTRSLIEDSRTRTPLVFVGSDGNGGRMFVFYHDRMADTALQVEELAEAQELIAHAAIFHFGSVTLSAEPSARATLQAAQWARQSGCMVSFDANIRLEVWNTAGRAHDTIVDTLSNVDILKVSNDEIQFITGSNDPVEASRMLRSKGPRLVVVTLGSDGCYYDAGASCGYVPGAAVEPVDTLGAGDAFLAGLLACLAAAPAAVLGDTSRLIESLKFANAVGALTTTRHGAIPALPRRVEVEQLLAAST